jgi:hypothetical protein
MKRRLTRINKLAYFVAIISLAIMISNRIAPTAGHPTTFYLDPATISKKAGDQFTITLRVDDVTDMYLWVVTIEWDPAYFDLVGNPIEGGCLKYGGSTTFLWGSITDGKIEGLTCTLLGEIPGVNVKPAPTTLATIRFLTQRSPPESGISIKITLGRYRDSAGTVYYPAIRDTIVLPTSVGGFVVPVDELGLLAPYIGLASTVLIASVATAIYVKRVKNRKEKQ